MYLAKVMGNTIATVKHSSMDGCKLLVVQPMMADQETPDGFPLVAIDTIGAGKGERVIITSDGVGTRKMLNADVTPVRWAVVGIAD